MTTKDEKPQRLLEIEPAEVSVVDEPAIRRRFIVTKRKSKEDVMAEEQTEESTEKAGEEEEEKATDMAPDESSETEPQKAEDGEEEEGGEEEEEEKADNPMQHIAALLPNLEQMVEGEDVDDETKAHVQALMEMMKAEDAEKSEMAEVKKQLAQLTLLVKKSIEGEEEEEEKEKAEDGEEEEPEKSADAPVTRAEFQSFQSEVVSAIETLAETQTSVAKSLGKIIPVAKGKDPEADGGQKTPKDVEKSDGALFGSVLGTGASE